MDLSQLPENLPIPDDDGACQHLPGRLLPSLLLPASDGGWLDMQSLTGLTVIYIFPMLGEPGKALPDNWDNIPGARGCTTQSCAFRDQFDVMQQRSVSVFGLSSQQLTDLQSAKNRLQLPYPLISDTRLQLTMALKLPTFTIQQQIYIQRITLICRDSVIEKVFYPVFPPDKNARQVIDYISSLAFTADPSTV